MKRKTWIGILSALCMATTCLALTACNGGKNNTPTNGVDGKSAYELYCQAYPDYEGTLEQWLESLQGAVGAQGEKGDKGDKGDTGAGIASVTVNAEGKLVITLTDGTVLPAIDLPTADGGETAESLRFQKIAGKEEYCVMGMGTVSSSDVVIPATYRGLPVTEIGEEAFRRELYIESIEIPSSIHKFYEDAFGEDGALLTVKFNGTISEWCSIEFEPESSPLERCENLYINNELVTELVIPDTVTEIKEDVFASYKKLTRVVISNSVTSIGDGAFSACDSLISVEIGDSVTSIGERAFDYCDSLTNITVSTNNDTYQSIDGNLYTKDGTVLIQYAIGKSDTSFTIPHSVTSIGRSAFSGCSSLTSVAFSDTTTWYKVYSYDDWLNKTGGTEIDVTDVSANADSFKSYSSYYYYKL